MNPFPNRSSDLKELGVSATVLRENSGATLQNVVTDSPTTDKAEDFFKFHEEASAREGLAEYRFKSIDQTKQREVKEAVQIPDLKILTNDFAAHQSSANYR
jgi:hypothetical protein